MAGAVPSTSPRQAAHLPVALVTGFDPFGGDTRNPSELAALALDGQVLAGHRVVGAVLPTVFGRSLEVLDELLARHRPALVLACGLAAGRASLSLERVAVNLDDARIPDNAGAQPIDTPVVAGGPAAYFSSLPVKAMCQALLQAGLPAEVSYSAGSFVCNHVFYGLMHRLAGRAGTRAGFMHLPGLQAEGSGSGTPQDAGGAPDGLSLARITQGLQIALACALATRKDLRVAGGALH